VTHAYDASREANLLAALALAVSDRIELAVARATGLEARAPAALLTLDSPSGARTVSGLAGALKLTHSGTVRLVDRLAAGGLVERRRGSDRRSVELALTPEGRRMVARVRAARADTAANLLSLLTTEQQTQLTIVQEAILGAVQEHSTELPWLCRLCDRYACRHGRGGCPVEEATRRRGLI
jgi:MarR family transcriptional regulator, negative regulator of the multidrug operon emrRAB